MHLTVITSLQDQDFIQLDSEPLATATPVILSQDGSSCILKRIGIAKTRNYHILSQM